MATAPKKPRTSSAPKMPAAAPKPQDHLPAKNDVKPEEITVSYEGEEYTVSTDVLDDVEILERLDRATFNPVGALRLMLGFDQWEKFKANKLRLSKADRVTVSDTAEFLNALLEKVQAGNS